MVALACSLALTGCGDENSTTSEARTPAAARAARPIETRNVIVVIGDGISFFQGLDTDVPLHLLEATPYKNGMVELRYEVRK